MDTRGRLGRDLRARTLLLISLVLGLAGDPPGMVHGQEIAAQDRLERMEDILSGLVSEDPVRQERVLGDILLAGDPEILPLLNSIHEGSLHVLGHPDGKHQVVLVEAREDPSGEEITYLLDPLTRKVLREWDELAMDTDEELLMVSVGSMEGRRLLRSAMAQLKLFDPAPRVRRSAAIKIGNHGSSSALPLLEKALQTETHRWPRHAMEEALNQILLADQDPVKRHNAAVRLGEIKALQSLPRLEALALEDEVMGDEAFREAVLDSIERIRAYQDLQQIVGVIFSGISLGSILLLMGLGLAITFGLMGVINMAHGEMMMIGAYTSFVMQELFSNVFDPSLHEFYFLVALPLSFAITGFVGLCLEKSVIRFLYGRPLETLLATWGVSLILQQAARWYFGDLTSVNAPAWMRGGVEVMVGLVLPLNRLFIIGLSVIAVLGITLLLFRTRWGLRIRAVTQNREMSACVGISTRMVDSWTFALGAGVAGLAGCAMSLVGNVDPEMGKTYIVDSFMVVVVGGVGKLAGTIVSAMGIGMTNKILEPMIGGTGGAIYAKLFILGGIILFLQRKPSGFFPAKGRSADST